MCCFQCYVLKLPNQADFKWIIYNKIAIIIHSSFLRGQGCHTLILSAFFFSGGGEGDCINITWTQNKAVL